MTIWVVKFVASPLVRRDFVPRIAFVAAVKTTQLDRGWLRDADNSLWSSIFVSFRRTKNRRVALVQSKETPAGFKRDVDCAQRLLLRRDLQRSSQQPDDAATILLDVTCVLLFGPSRFGIL